MSTSFKVSAVADDSSDDSNVASGCSALWEVDRSKLTADQRSDLATFEKDYYDAESLSDDGDTQQPALRTKYSAGTSAIQHSVPNSQHPALNSQHSALGTQHSVTSTQYSVPNTQ